MAIISSAIFGRSAFIFGRIRIIRFISSEKRCSLNMTYKHVLAMGWPISRACLRVWLSSFAAQEKRGSCESLH